MNRVRVIGPKDPKVSDAIITTSISKGLGRQFSPFILGPVPLYKGAPIASSKNVENAWQFSKVYPEHIDSNDMPTKEYFEWAARGFSDYKAYRYPMGKGKIPMYSWWDGKKLSYIEARKKIYIPLYAGSVIKTKAFKLLKQGYDQGHQITLWDFDGYDYLKEGKTFKDVVVDPTKSMGHAFILAALLEGTLKKEG